MKIGNIDIGKKLFLAPMAEITDSSFRKICKEHGAGFTFTQMVSAAGVVNNNFETLRNLSFHISEKPIGVQILGNDPIVIGEAVKEISKLKPDLIDLNSGCPVEKVTSNLMGAALLDDPIRIGKIVASMVKNSGGIPISVKIRLGKNHKKINVIEVAKSIEDNGASIIFIHARTREEKYDSEPHWEWIRKVKENVNIPVVGNGSLFNPEDICQMFKETNCDSAMIARGAIGNPFIFERYNSLIETGIDPGEPSIDLIRKVLLKQIDLLKEEYGEIKCIDKVKKNIIWYFRNFQGIEELMEKVFSQQDLNSLKILIDEHTEKIQYDFYKSQCNYIINAKFKKKVLFWLKNDYETIG
ncbi:MAG: tRNA dihydrouridine synthase DusB [Melioribacter sp.]|uniref:tRNA dihydrouridine synthase DusB n=1 Tax=Rosettibacter primus TaxID=3111523 RepID=UPI00247C1F9C|nr:tRNA dihydrouridine synthase DusB [Melioribacter sp.]